MLCSYFNRHQCASCSELTTPYEAQITSKTAHLTQLLADFSIKRVFPPVESAPLHFRSKAKMAVSGSVEHPALGAIKPDHSVTDLSECPLYPASMQALFPILKQFIFKAGLTPYDIKRKKGELKYIIVTQSQSSQQFMVRFVLRSSQKMAQLRAALPWLQGKAPEITVVSANIQPAHAAILEGKEEILLTPEHALEECFNGISLNMRPRSFFQTNPAITATLYAQAQTWTADLPISHVWDLFCGVGGFGLHCVAGTERRLTGIEISPDAIASARQSAAKMRVKQVNFQALDLTRSALEIHDKPELVIVNPPRRGLGKNVCDFLAELAPDYLLYSSCNAATLANDLRCLSHYTLEKVQLFDMFPHTPHYEVLVFLVKNTQMTVSQ